MSVIGNTKVLSNWDEVADHTAANSGTAVFLAVDVNYASRIARKSRPDNYTALSPDEARELARELIAIADQYDHDAEENAKPKLPTEPGLYINAIAYPIIAPIFRYTAWEGWTMKTDTPLPPAFSTVREWVTKIHSTDGLKRLVVEP